jgi:carboxynorspermidine decarboxylase
MTIDYLIDSVETPAFVYDEAEVQRVLDVAGKLQADTGCRVLYSVKPLCLSSLLEMMTPQLSGFAVSSLFEAKLARSVMTEGAAIHFTSPGVRPREASELGECCDYIAFNSLSQWRRFGPAFTVRCSRGLRVNPGLSFLDDERYDPCRPYSKLGVPMDELASLARQGKLALDGIDGILVHSNCESTNFRELRHTVDRLTDEIPNVLARQKWLNLGGGYLFEEGVDLEPLRKVVRSLRTQYGVDIFLEPGAAFVRSAGYIVSSVLDIFSSSGKDIAVLDATVNHMPELLEFDFEPDVAGHDDEGAWPYILAGCTCLAGDTFGEYRFNRPLAVGDRVVILNAGSYSLTKAHTFNGVNLPNVYCLDKWGRMQLIKKFTFEEFAARWETDVRIPV